MDRSLKFGKDDALNYREFLYTVIYNGIVEHEVKIDSIESGITGDRKVDNAVLRTLTDYIDLRCWHTCNGDYSRRNDPVQRNYYDTPVTVIITKDCN